MHCIAINRKLKIDKKYFLIAYISKDHLVKRFTIAYVSENGAYISGMACRLHKYLAWLLYTCNTSAVKNWCCQNWCKLILELDKIYIIWFKQASLEDWYNVKIYLLNNVWIFMHFGIFYNIISILGLKSPRYFRDDGRNPAELYKVHIIVDRPATPKSRFNHPANNMDIFPRNLLFGS